MLPEAVKRRHGAVAVAKEPEDEEDEDDSSLSSSSSSESDETDEDSEELGADLSQEESSDEVTCPTGALPNLLFSVQ